ncbi:hypothetical protein C8R44DRAFT_202191 [Mycena epipterygia]|nr:hypothetical protein C8R44DRAFT_202191 [Mycena epipterygia]
MVDSRASPQPASNLGRGAACSNCRRRKIRCDGTRPVCNQCKLRPPRSGVACVFDLDAEAVHQTAAQMQDTIRVLKSRIHQLESLPGQGASQILLHQPYHSHRRSSDPTPNGTEPMHSPAQEPPAQVVVTYVDVFLKTFTNSGYFFLEPHRFRNSALLPLPFGHLDRPCQSLLSVVYLWGSIISSTVTPASYTEELFLRGALQSIWGDVQRCSVHPKLVLETIQAEVMLSLYYLHVAQPVQGRYHSAAAVSLAMSAGLHRLRVPPEATFHFHLAQSLLPPAVDLREEAERMNAFWAVVIVNNTWVAADGCPSIITYSTAIGTPWPSSSQAGATITKFLNGNDQEGRSPVALLAKSSILLERIIACSSNSTGPATLSSLDTRLHTFHSALPRLSGDRNVFMAHALTDLAIIHLHAPSSRASNTARHKCLTAANRIISNLATINLAEAIDPMLGPVCATVTTVYMQEMASLRMSGGGAQARAEYHELDLRVGSLMNVMAPLAPKIPLIQRWMLSTRQAYAELTHPR